MWLRIWIYNYSQKIILCLEYFAEDQNIAYTARTNLISNHIILNFFQQIAIFSLRIIDLN